MRQPRSGFRTISAAWFRSVLTPLLMLVALLAAWPSHAVEYVQFKTVEGCSVVEVRSVATAYERISWSGKCRNGLAEGTGKLVHTWKHDGKANTSWETLEAGRRPFETADVYSYLENSQTYILFKKPGQSAVKITEADCLAAPGCWTIAKARGKTNGTPAPKAGAPLSGAAVAVSSGTAAMGIDFRFENKQGGTLIVGSGGPCATTDLGLYRVEATPSSLMARQKGGQSVFLETPRYSVIGEAAPGLPVIYAWNEFTARDINEMLRRAASNLSTPEAKKNYRQMQCVARNHVQYEQAIYGWFKLNWKSCPQRCQMDSSLYIPRDMQ